MSTPLQFDVPADVGVLRDTPTIGWCMTGVRADAVRVGQFTTFNGYRRVCSVAEGWVTEGRGKKRRTYLASITLERADGSVDKLAPDDELTVYAPDC